MIDGSTIAAILTGILALIGALASAWMSGLNEKRVQSRASEKILARYSVPLLIAAWDLANWFYDITDDENYSPKRCAAYGDGWNSEFTSYLIGQYFAGVHIIREMTQFFAHLKGPEADKLKKLLWKIQDEFITMNYEGRESLEMRWFEGDILAVQEHMTQHVDHDGDGTAQELRTIGWVEFQKAYALASDSGNEESPEAKEKSPELQNLFDWYEKEFQRIIYRRFKWLYEHKYIKEGEENPQGHKKLMDDHNKAMKKKQREIEKMKIHHEDERAKSRDKETSGDKLKEDEEKRNKLEREKEEEIAKIEKKHQDVIEEREAEEEKIQEENKNYPNITVIVPDHRIRRLQHLLSDLVVLLDTVSTMKLNRPVRRSHTEYSKIFPSQTGKVSGTVVNTEKNPLGLGTGDRIPCDCSSLGCNPTQTDFEKRHLPNGKPSHSVWRKSSKSTSQKTIRQDNASKQGRIVVEESKV